MDLVEWCLPLLFPSSTTTLTAAAATITTAILAAELFTGV